MGKPARDVAFAKEQFAVTEDNRMDSAFKQKNSLICLRILSWHVLLCVFVFQIRKMKNVKHSSRVEMNTQVII